MARLRAAAGTAASSAALRPMRAATALRAACCSILGEGRAGRGVGAERDPTGAAGRHGQSGRATCTWVAAFRLMPAPEMQGGPGP